MSFTPKFTITPSIAKALSSIEASKTAMLNLPITVSMLATLRESARLSSTHNSTAIEGNRLSLEEVRKVIQNTAHFPHREKDEEEVRNYYKALDQIDLLVKKEGSIVERDIQLLHGISFLGSLRPTPYRDGQNVIRAGKLIVYIPPKAQDVLSLMRDLFDWINSAIKDDIPLPLIAGLAHYQFATIHPYFDGNGRTARLFVTLILHKYGYGLNGIYSLEEYYAQNLQAYYQALTIGSEEDYYDGKRAEADLTPFLNFFIKGMALSFEKIKAQAEVAQNRGEADTSQHLRKLNTQQKFALSFFKETQQVTAKDIATLFQINDRQARYLCQQWVSAGFFEVANASAKKRSYRLVEEYEKMMLQT